MRCIKAGKNRCYYISFCVWLFVTACLLTAAVSLPFWVASPPQNSSPSEAYGILSSCSDISDFSTCKPYGANPSSIPVELWRYAAAFFTFAAVASWVFFVLAVVMCCSCDDVFKSLIRYGYIAIGICAAASMLLFFAAFDDTFLFNECNTSAVFSLGDCTIGVCSGLGILASVMAIVSPCVSCAAENVEEKPYAD